MDEPQYYLTSTACLPNLQNTHPPGCVVAQAPDGQDAAVSWP